ncbi:Serine/threonine-protein phosphatase PP1-alpha [Tritrichomonas foetus]|uniref:Serine/threonine-protein phosphatase n=1 Tax=Tritrichomonas foetus TaxID=1144522 RepID=A0A1J4JM54_9EUKA|nr:Serine/threonine-protein phosphatase PP1-alpha [Tritrichomonas foetus]|eukprot:OHS98643.1 Serine/threonine-protein phosphatase PP1-alpha [Tritrichomonas foetus]
MEYQRHNSTNRFIPNQPNNTDIADFILKSFNEILEDPSFTPNELGKTYLIPNFEDATISKLLEQAYKRFCQLPPLVSINDDVIIVGDLHGSLLDLLRIFRENGLPPSVSYVFLGDYVDRGNWSIEVVIILIAMKVKFPKNIVLIRGNHEFESICSKYGFKDQLESVYPKSSIFGKFIDLFGELPIACIVNKSIFCVHGGLSPLISNVKQISLAPKPMQDNNVGHFKDLFWGDPSSKSPFFSESERNFSKDMHNFGQEATRDFLEKNNFTLLVRGHSYIEKGIEYHFNKMCITLFSASSYSTNNVGNSAILKVSSDLKIKKVIYPSIQRLERDPMFFFNMKHPSNKNNSNLPALGGIKSTLSVRAPSQLIISNQFRIPLSRSLMKSSVGRFNLIGKIANPKTFAKDSENLDEIE